MACMCFRGVGVDMHVEPHRARRIIHLLCILTQRRVFLHCGFDVLLIGDLEQRQADYLGHVCLSALADTELSGLQRRGSGGVELE
jgi:hypothetical protein